MLCKHTDLVRYGTAAVFDSLLSDLKKLEVDGADLGPEFGELKVIVLSWRQPRKSYVRGFLESFISAGIALQQATVWFPVSVKHAIM